MWTNGWRDSLWAGLDRPWDIIIIGGGITGAGILREAARIGLRALLLEAGDFSSGTSSRSSKLVHSGLRYLRNGQIRTTISSVHEREQLLREGKGLITPLSFLFAIFEGDKVSRWQFGLGLAIYDSLGLRWGHRWYGPADLHKLAPQLTLENLSGGFRYFDAQTDDARLVFRLIREGVRDGGFALNYARVEDVLLNQSGKVCGVAVCDSSPDGYGRTRELEARVVINASGAAADVLRGRVGGARRLRCLRGSHLVFPSEKFPIARAISFAHPVDQRPIFALPWEGVTLFGTTDVDHIQVGEMEPKISPGETDYLMSAIDTAFPTLALDQDDIQATFAGVRAVEDTGCENPSQESREHLVWQEKGLLTVTGGKLTTFRVMAQDALQLVRKQLPSRPRLQRKRVLDEVIDLPPMPDLPPTSRVRLAGRYGAELSELVDAACKEELTPLEKDSSCPSLWAELRWAARAEGVVHLEDLLLRRVRLGLLLPEGGLPWLEKIRPVVQSELGWDDLYWQREVNAYRRLWLSTYSPPDWSAAPALISESNSR